MNNGAGQAAKAERQARSEIKHGSNDNANRAKNQKGPSEFAERVHTASLEVPEFRSQSARTIASDQLVPSEEVTDLEGSGIGRVRTVRDVVADACAEIAANGAGCGFVRVRGADGIEPRFYDAFCPAAHRDNVDRARKILT